MKKDAIDVDVVAALSSDARCGRLRVDGHPKKQHEKVVKSGRAGRAYFEPLPPAGSRKAGTWSPKPTDALIGPCRRPARGRSAREASPSRAPPRCSSRGRSRAWRAASRGRSSCGARAASLVRRLVLRRSRRGARARLAAARRFRRLVAAPEPPRGRAAAAPCLAPSCAAPRRSSRTRGRGRRRRARAGARSDGGRSAR